MRSWNQKNLHFSGTSRQETEIKDILYSLATDIIPLEESVVDGDILTYVPYQLQHDFKLLERSEETHKEIQIALLNGANGMFRWGVCQLDAIRVCMRLGLLRKASRSLPKTLDETYARITTKVPKEHVEDAGRILSYLIRAFGPVTIEEDAETVAIVIKGKPYCDIESQLQEPRDVLTICSGLVSTTESCWTNERCGGKIHSKKLRLSHSSVKEYLLLDRSAPAQASRFALNERYAHELLAKMCVKHLLWCGQEDLHQDPLFDKSAFARYAASLWSGCSLVQHF